MCQSLRLKIRPNWLEISLYVSVTVIILLSQQCGAYFAGVGYVPVFLGVSLAQLAKWAGMAHQDGKKPFRAARAVVAARRVYVDFWVWDYGEGKMVRRRYGRIPGRTREEKVVNAAQVARQITELLESGYCIGRPERAGEGLAHVPQLQALERLLNVRTAGARGRTVETYVSYFRSWKLWSEATGREARQLGELSRADVLVYLDYLALERGASLRTRNNHLAFLDGLFRMACGRGWADSNPAEGIPRGRTASRAHVVFTDEDQAALERVLQAEEPDLWAICALMYWGGLREAEICRLQVGDVDLAGFSIRVYAARAKSKKARYVRIVNRLGHILAGYMPAGIPADWYLVGRGLRPGPVPTRPERMRERFVRVLKALGLEGRGYTMYSWRHTGVCRAYLSGMDIWTIKEHLGHYSVQETETYLRGLVRLRRKGVEQFEW